MNTQQDINQDDDFLLEQIFAEARAEQPELVDDNFTKMVANSLPRRVTRVNKSSMSYDLLGLLLGAFAVLFVVDFAALKNYLTVSSQSVASSSLNEVGSALTTVQSAIPSSVSVSVSAVLLSLALVTIACVAGWIWIEKPKFIREFL